MDYFLSNIVPNLLANIVWAPITWVVTHLIVRRHVDKLHKKLNNEKVNKRK